MRVYPHHNNVRVRRVWEAGVCLAGYIKQHPDAIWGRSVMEVRSGVGLTVLVFAGLCHPRCVNLTGFTNTCITNLAHNAKVVNLDWLEGQGVVMGKGRTLTTVRDPRGLSRCPLF